jgi:predicted Fe-Mo cluster-binding NifX family protein
MNHRLAIAIDGYKDNNNKVAANFGNCSKFIIYEINSQKEIVSEEEYFNPLRGHHEELCQLPGYIKQFEVDTLITGNIGQKAVSNFNEYGIAVIIAPGLCSENVLSLFLQNKLISKAK